ncbi:hypothetical protein KP778_00190 [Streptococcus equi subsp. zooepidemicus]|nr:hypothetical protein [Streptococcus equi]MCD3462386.1 hypothetical protein [Streptococcus equi subsp. zooepidemicus]
MRLLIKLTHIFIEKMDAIKTHYKLKTEAQEKYMDEVIKDLVNFTTEDAMEKSNFLMSLW